MIDGRVHVHVRQEEADEQFDQHEDARVTRQGALAMFLVCVCVCDTGGATAANFLSEEVINAPAWL